MAEIPWDAILKLIMYLIEVLGKSKGEAIAEASAKFGISQSIIRRHLDDK